MIEKIKKVFGGELQIENIRKIATHEYEIDTYGYNYYYSGWKIPMGTFSLMFDYGFNNIRIMKSIRKDNEYLITMRFTIDKERMEERLQEDKEWRERWEKLTSLRQS